MRHEGGSSWTISVDRWSQRCDIALWIRELAGIKTPADGLIPGPMHLDMARERAAQRTSAELVAEWAAWWHALVTIRSARPTRFVRPEAGPYDPPAFVGVERWPILYQLVLEHWQEAVRRSADRLHAGIEADTYRSASDSKIIADIEIGLGRTVRPFQLELTLLPVQDDGVRRVSANHCLVPEALYDGARWPSALRTLVAPLA